jgi:hypothetical protein
MTARAYLSAEQLAELTPWTQDAVEKMVRRGVLVRGIHYFQPFGRRARLLFKWSAIVSLIEAGTVQPGSDAVIQDEPVADGAANGSNHILNVEKATTKLQRLLG